MIKRLATTLGIPALAVLAALGPVGSAQGRSILFMHGRADHPTNIPCVSIDFSTGVIFNRMTNPAIANSACGTVFFELPLPIDAAGTKTVTFTARASVPASATQCRAMGVARDQAVQSSSPFAVSVRPNDFADIPMMAVNVPTSGYLYLDCDLPGGAVFSTATYNQ